MVIGGSGQLGNKLTGVLRANGFDVGLTFTTSQGAATDRNSYLLNKTERASVNKVVDLVRPEIVIDTAALTNVDYCEMHKEEATLVNAEGTLNVALACERKHAKMVYISTDYVFDGEKGRYTEDDLPRPINHYGKTKLEGEINVARTCGDKLIARSSVIYSWTRNPPTGQPRGVKPLNFAAWIVDRLLAEEQIRVVTDQFCSPTLADSLADVLVQCLKRDMKGIFHIAGKTRASRFEFAMMLAERLGLRRDLIRPARTPELKQVARRPNDSSLNVEKAESAIGHELQSLDEALATLAHQADTGSRNSRVE